ncbi:MAG: hypothetical protein JWO06_185 [Bacteroidota bacterium]|nr:hypothetical protein [Bacteroidota bacterium]
MIDFDRSSQGVRVFHSMGFMLKKIRFWYILIIKLEITGALKTGPYKCAQVLYKRVSITFCCTRNSGSGYIRTIDVEEGRALNNEFCEAWIQSKATKANAGP